MVEDASEKRYLFSKMLAIFQLLAELNLSRQQITSCLFRNRFVAEYHFCFSFSPIFLLLTLLKYRRKKSSFFKLYWFINSWISRHFFFFFLFYYFFCHCFFIGKSGFEKLARNARDAQEMRRMRRMSSRSPCHLLCAEWATPHENEQAMRRLCAGCANPILG